MKKVGIGAISTKIKFVIFNCTGLQDSCAGETTHTRDMEMGHSETHRVPLAGETTCRKGPWCETSGTNDRVRPPVTKDHGQVHRIVETQKSDEEDMTKVGCMTGMYPGLHRWISNGREYHHLD